MKSKRRKIAIAVVFCIGAALIVAFLDHESEPYYRGRPLSLWLKVWVRHVEDVEREEAERAVLAIGTNALPYLVKWIQYDSKPSEPKQLLFSLLERLPRSIAPGNFRNWNFWEDSSERRAYFAPAGFSILGTKAESAIPELKLIANTSRTEQVSGRATEALRRIGPTAVPALITLVTSTNLLPRVFAIGALRDFGAIIAEPALPVLINSLHDRESQVVFAAAEALFLLDLETQTTFAAWTNTLSDSRDSLRLWGVHAVARFDNETYPVVPCLLRMLDDEQPVVRTAASNELSEIDPDVFTIVPTR